MLVLPVFDLGIIINHLTHPPQHTHKAHPRGVSHDSFTMKAASPTKTLRIKKSALAAATDGPTKLMKKNPRSPTKVSHIITRAIQQLLPSSCCRTTFVVALVQGLYCAISPCCVDSSVMALACMLVCVCVVQVREVRHRATGCAFDTTTALSPTVDRAGTHNLSHAPVNPNAFSGFKVLLTHTPRIMHPTLFRHSPLLWCGGLAGNIEAVAWLVLGQTQWLRWHHDTCTGKDASRGQGWCWRWCGRRQCQARDIRCLCEEAQPTKHGAAPLL